MSKIERPIIFQGKMVRPILNGDKTQTRRVLKTQPGKFQHIDHDESQGWHMWWDVVTYDANLVMGADQEYVSLKCPYGQPGDRLWVRETWRCLHWVESEEDQRGLQIINYQADGKQIFKRFSPGKKARHTVGWRPSIHIRRWASRITLEITGIRVERVQEISEEDAKAEGVGRESDFEIETHTGGCVQKVLRHRRAFETLWDSIAKPGKKWVDNPWVWIVEFERIES